jgi:4,5-dihydroxyphthalate decarboxylase
MTVRVPLTLACGDYEIHRGLKEGTVPVDGVDLTVLTDMDSSTRHWRFLRNREFDVAECSCSSYIIARDQGLPFRAIPVFPHRRFRHGFVFINTGKGITKPADLIGKKIGVKSFQVTAVHWLRGILESEYGVPHRSIDWYAEIDEDVEFVPPPGLKLTRLPHDQGVEAMLVEGKLDAVLHSDLIEPFLKKDKRVARLFSDHKAEEKAYFQKTGIFPIMHVVALREETVQKYPWVAVNLFKAFERAKAAALKRMENPRIAPLAWYREAWEEQQEVLGPDPWVNGLTEQNAKTLETLMRYSHEQGLTKRLLTLDEMFLDVSEGRKRGGFRF